MVLESWDRLITTEYLALRPRLWWAMIIIKLKQKMKKANLFHFDVDRPNNQIKVTRSFDAPLDMVWSAWTEAEILDQWWAPKPWVAKTKTMDFREGGFWLYAMVGPENEEHYGRVDYTAFDGFCDSDGKLDASLPRNQWETQFIEQNQQTLVNVRLTFDSLEDLEKIIEMGFEEGFTAGLENLDEYIESQSPQKRTK